MPYLYVKGSLQERAGQVVAELSKIELRHLSKVLGLEYYCQDWGICNSCSNRVEEFIRFYESRSNCPNHVKWDLVELIIASYNDRIVEGNANPTSDEMFKAFISRHKWEYHVRFQANYWKKIIEHEEFPIGKFFTDIDVSDMH